MSVKDLYDSVKDKDRLKHILSLRKEKKYDEIYHLYGKTIYKIATPHSYKKKDLNKLFKEGKYEDVLYKYGKDTYSSNMHKAIMQDVYIETGSKLKAFLSSAKYYLAHKVAPVFLSATILIPTTSTVALSYISKNSIDKNTIEYAEELEEYGQKIENYAKSVRDMNLSHVQIIMKVISDMWNDIKGYGTPQRDIYGLSRLDMLEQDPVLVCRNMADHVTAVLNEINPEYNARNVPVYMDSDQNFHLANIDRNIINPDETISDEETQNENSDGEFLDTLTKFTGNHMVTAIDIPGENSTLIIDSTNPSIGVYKDGNIHMFSSKDGKGLYPKEFMNFVFYGTDFVDFVSDITKTFKEPDLSLEELEKIYGIDALNTALKELDEIEKNESSFDSRYKVNLEELASRKQDTNNSLSKNNNENER